MTELRMPNGCLVPGCLNEVASQVLKCDAPPTPEVLGLCASHLPTWISDLHRAIVATNAKYSVIDSNPVAVNPAFLCYRGMSNDNDVILKEIHGDRSYVFTTGYTELCLLHNAIVHHDKNSPYQPFLTLCRTLGWEIKNAVISETLPDGRSRGAGQGRGLRGGLRTAEQRL